MYESIPLVFEVSPSCVMGFSLPYIAHLVCSLLGEENLALLRQPLLRL
jgi:hypothetical protein